MPLQVRPRATKDTPDGQLLETDSMDEAEMCAAIHESTAPVVIVQTETGFPLRWYPCHVCKKSGRRGTCEHQP